jgi:hypothetical protein
VAEEELVALAQDLFSTSSDASEERRDERYETDEVDAHRPSRPSRVRKAAEEEAQLARMVRELHELEDSIVAKVTSAERLLAQLAARRTHEDGGYPSWSEFETRMLAPCPVLRAMRQSLATTATPRPTPGAARRDPADARARQSRALTSMARTLDRLRGLEAEMHQAASEAHSKLHTIEVMRVYDECGYVSFEEFLERALGPSPVLASAVSLVASEQVGDPRGEPVAAMLPNSAAEPGEGNDFPPSLFTDTQDPLLDEPPPLSSTDQSPAETSSAEQALPPPPRRTTLVVSVVLCIAAIVAGAAAGIASGVLASKQQGPESAASAIAPTSAVAPAKPPTKGDPTPGLASAPHPLTH